MLSEIKGEKNQGGQIETVILQNRSNWSNTSGNIEFKSNNIQNSSPLMNMNSTNHLASWNLIMKVLILMVQGTKLSLDGTKEWYTYDILQLEWGLYFLWNNQLCWQNKYKVNCRSRGQFLIKRQLILSERKRKKNMDFAIWRDLEQDIQDCCPQQWAFQLIPL